MNLRTKFAFSICLLGLLCLVLPSAVWADDAALTLNTYTNYTNGGWTLAYEFSPTVDINVTALGSYFPGGATDVHGVTVWDMAGNVLASSTVTGIGIEGLDYTAIGTSALAAGVDYVIGTTTLTDNYADCSHDANGNPIACATWTMNPDINYIIHRETPTAGVTPIFPTDGGNVNDFGPNFMFRVPEPSSLILLGTGLFLLRLRRRTA